MQVKSFTFASERIERELPCDVISREASITNSNESRKQTTIRAIWDTGATASVITAKVARALNLKPISMTKVHTAGGERICNVYIVDLILPNDVYIPNVQVTEADMTTNDVLIGMDIITLGDFAITNLGGKTRFTFSIPSTRIIDFVQESKDQKRKHLTHGGSKDSQKRKQERTNKKRARRSK